MVQYQVLDESIEEADKPRSCPAVASPGDHASTQLDRWWSAGGHGLAISFDNESELMPPPRQIAVEWQASSCLDATSCTTGEASLPSRASLSVSTVTVTEPEAGPPGTDDGDGSLGEYDDEAASEAPSSQTPSRHLLLRAKAALIRLRQACDRLPDNSLAANYLNSTLARLDTCLHRTDLESTCSSSVDDCCQRVRTVLQFLDSGSVQSTASSCTAEECEVDSGSVYTVLESVACKTPDADTASLLRDRSSLTRLKSWTPQDLKANSNLSASSDCLESVSDLFPRELMDMFDWLGRQMLRERPHLVPQEELQSRCIKQQEHSQHNGNVQLVARPVATSELQRGRFHRACPRNSKAPVATVLAQFRCRSRQQQPAPRPATNIGSRRLQSKTRCQPAHRTLLREIYDRDFPVAQSPPSPPTELAAAAAARKWRSARRTRAVRVMAVVHSNNNGARESTFSAATSAQLASSA